MIDPSLSKLFFTMLSYGAAGAAVGVGLRLWKRNESSLGLGETAGIGFLLGLAWGAFYGIFQALVS